MSRVFIKANLASPIFTEVDDDDTDWTNTSKTLHVGSEAKESIHSYSNIVITTPDQTFPSKLEIDLSDVEASDGSLKLKLRKVKVCDGNGNTGQVYVLCSEVFQSDTGFNSGDELMSP